MRTKQSLLGVGFSTIIFLLAAKHCTCNKDTCDSSVEWPEECKHDEYVISYDGICENAFNGCR